MHLKTLSTCLDVLKGIDIFTKLTTTMHYGTDMNALTIGVKRLTVIVTAYSGNITVVVDA